MRYLFEEYVLDTDRRELHRGADAVSVAPQVFDILDYLIGNGKVSARAGLPEKHGAATP